MYFLKTKGTAQIPDYIQVRNSEFVLIAHFRADKIKENLKKLNLENIISFEKLEELVYGKLQKIIPTNE